MGLEGSAQEWPLFLEMIIYLMLFYVAFRSFFLLLRGEVEALPGVAPRLEMAIKVVSYS